MALDPLNLPGTLDALAPLRAYAAKAAEEAGLDKKASYNLCLAVDEVATNVVLHGYEEQGKSGPIRAWASVTDAALTFVLEDEGASYDPSGHELPTEEELKLPLEQRLAGGLGIYLAYIGVDRLDYESKGGRNRHSFVMKLRPGGGASRAQMSS